MSIAVLPPVSGVLPQQSHDANAVDARTAKAFGEVLEAQRAAPASGTLAPRRTPLNAQQAASAIRNALTRARGVAPKSETVAVLTAQWAHETAHGSRMFNYNFGGIKGASPEGLSVMQRTREGWGSSERQIVDRFRAYRNPEEGAADYVHLLETRYGSALASAEAGDAAGFVRGLKAKGYFTGDEQAYARSVAQVAGEFLGGRTEGLRPLSPNSLDFPGERAPFAFPSPELSAGVETLTASSFLQAQNLIDQLARASLRSVSSDGDAEQDT